MAKAKQVQYTGTADIREIGDLRWDRENNWTVKQADVPADVLKEMKDGSLVGEFNVGVDADETEDSGVTETVT